jgi:hypothetical protein
MIPEAVYKAAKNNRVWDGMVHVTDLTNGIREAYLRYTTKWEQSPEDAAFALAGTGLGMAIQAHAPRESVEVLVLYNGISGRIDLLEGDVIHDFKHVGAYTVKKLLGLEKYDAEIVDAHGVPERYKSGQKKGQVKTRKQFRFSPEAVDMFPYNWQLNSYRFMRKEMTGRDSQMFLQVFVRDGGTMAGSSHGVDGRYYQIEVPAIPDDQVKAFLDTRSKALKDAMESKKIPDPCEERFSWKCERYCPVREACEKVGCPWLKQ